VDLIIPAFDLRKALLAEMAYLTDLYFIIDLLRRLE